MIKLLAIDMDGTCLDDKHRISLENMAALQRAAQAGILVVPTTGRAATCLPGQLMNEHFYRYIISSNGADVADVETRESLFRAQITSKRAVRLLQSCREAGLGLSVHARHEFLIEGRPLHLLGRISYGKDAENSICKKNLVQYLKHHHTDVEEIQLFYFSDRERAAARQLLADQADLTAAYDHFYVEIYDKGASKGNALKALSDHLGLAKEEVACIGDAENDFSMFDAAGTKFAMGNAIEPLKQKADFVLPGNNESGVAAAITEHILI